MTYFQQIKLTVIAVIVALTIGNVVQARFLFQQEPCSDITPDDKYSCQQQSEWGKCDEEWIVQGQFCQKSCGRCGNFSTQNDQIEAGCWDQVPSYISCQQLRDEGRCDFEDRTQDGQTYCDLTCGRCQSNENTYNDESTKQCRLNNCTIFEYYGSNPFHRNDGAGGRRKLTQAVSSLFVNPQASAAPFQTSFVPTSQLRISVPETDSEDNGGQTGNTGTSMIIVPDGQGDDNTGGGQEQSSVSIFIPNQSSNNPPSSSTQGDSDSQQLVLPVPFPQISTQRYDQDQESSAQGGLVSFQYSQDEPQKDSYQQYQPRQSNSQYLSMYGESAVLDPGQYSFTNTDFAKAATTGFGLEQRHQECDLDANIALLDPCCEQYVVQSEDQICDLAARSYMDCEQFKVFNDLWEVYAGLIIQIC